MSPALVRLDLPCQSVGFEPPPAPVHLRFLARGDAWTLLVVAPAGRAPEVAAWVRAQTPAVVLPAPGVAPRTLRCQLTDLPPRWLAWLTAVRVIQLDLTPQGTATLFVQGTPLQLADLAGALQGGPQPMRRHAGPHDGLHLTSKQLDVLSNAVAMGYYDVPHRVDLRRLGRSMGLSVSAVSQLLRRAQAQVVRSFVDKASLAQGQRLSDDTERAQENVEDGPKGA